MLGLLGSYPLLGRELYRHPLTLKHRHLINFGILLKVVGKPKQQHLALLLEEDRASLKENIRLHLVAIAQKADGVLQLEVVVVVVGLRTEANLFHIDLDLFSFLFLLTLLQLVQEFRVIDYSANRGLCIRGDFDQIGLMFLSQAKRLGYGIDLGFYFVAYYANFFGTDLLVDPMLPF